MPIVRLIGSYHKYCKVSSIVLRPLLSRTNFSALRFKLKQCVYQQICIKMYFSFTACSDVCLNREYTYLIKEKINASFLLLNIFSLINLSY